MTSAEARANLPALLRRVQAGQRVTITRYNKPVADLVPLAAAEYPVPRFGLGKGKAAILDPVWDNDPKTNAAVAAWLEGKFE